MAAGIATLEVYKEQGIFENANNLTSHFETLLHSLQGLPHVIDIRNIGLMGAVEVMPIPGFPTARSMDIFDRAFEKGLLIFKLYIYIYIHIIIVCIHVYSKDSIYTDIRIIYSI